MALIKEVGVKFFNNVGLQENLGVFPINEDAQNTISFSHEWWHPVQEVMNFLKDTFEAMDISFITAMVSAATDIPKLLGVNFKPLNQFAKAWKNPAEPFTINLTLSFRFGQKGKYNAHSEVVSPIMELAKRTLPVFIQEGEEGTLIAGPGPKPLDILASAGSQLLGILQTMPGQAELDKKRQNERDFLQQFELFREDKGIGWNDSRIEKLYNLAKKAEMKDVLEAYFYGGNVDKAISAHTSAEAELEKIAQDAKENFQMTRTWQLTFSGYVFRYLVCVGSQFTFEPEVDNNRFPIQGSISMMFQPYLIALANTIGLPLTGARSDRDGNTTAQVYGWSDREGVNRSVYVTPGETYYSTGVSGGAH